MNTQKGFAKPQLSKEDLIKNLEHCALCGEKLLFSHQTNYLTLEVCEESTCSSCGLRKNAVGFILQ